MNWERMHLNWGDMIWYDLRSAAFPMLPRSSRAASKNFFPCLPLGRICARAAPNLVQCFELEIRKQFWLQVVHNRKTRWKRYINTRILFVGYIEVHSIRVWLCSWWGRSWSSRYLDFSNVSTAVSAAGFTWDSVGSGAACWTIWIMLHEVKCKNSETTW